MSTVTETVVGWLPPGVGVGDKVVWLRDGHDPCPADVVDVSRDVIDVDTHGGTNRVHGIRHIDDPMLKQFPDQKKDLGCWAISPQVIQMNKIEAEFNKVKDNLATVADSAESIREMMVVVEEVQRGLDKLTETIGDVSERVSVIEKKIHTAAVSVAAAERKVGRPKKVTE